MLQKLKTEKVRVCPLILQQLQANNVRLSPVAGFTCSYRNYDSGKAGMIWKEEAAAMYERKAVSAVRYILSILNLYQK